MPTKKSVEMKRPTFDDYLKKDLKDPKFRKLYEQECLRLDIELILRKVITRATHKGTANRVVIQTTEAIMKKLNK